MELFYRFNCFIEKWMALVTPAGLLAGVIFPELTSKGLPFISLVFAFMTFIGGLKSSFRDVADIFQRPLPLLLSLLVLHVVIPACAFLAGTACFQGNLNVITGMVLEFVVPCAVVSLMWVSIYRGSSSLSLSVVVLDTLLAPISIPLTLRMLVGSSVDVDGGGMMKDLLLMLAMPALFALCLIFVVTCNSSKVAPYIRNMTQERAAVAAVILLLAAGGSVRLADQPEVWWTCIKGMIQEDFTSLHSLAYLSSALLPRNL